jgi:hypothetical protein
VDPDLSMGLMDPYPDSQSGSGSKKAKMAHKKYRTVHKFHLLKFWMFFFRAEGFS